MVVWPLGFAQYEIPNVDKHQLRSVEEYDEVIPERAPKTIKVAARKIGKDHYIGMRVKDAEYKQSPEAKMLSRSPMRALQHMACDKLKRGKRSCEIDTALLTSAGNQANATDTPDTLQLAVGAEFTVTRRTAELHGTHARKKLHTDGKLCIEMHGTPAYSGKPTSSCRGECGIQLVQRPCPLRPTRFQTLANI